jgi:hypothetical protein
VADWHFEATPDVPDVAHLGALPEALWSIVPRCHKPAPISGKHERHRLNRSGDRQANSALRHIVITRMVYDQRTTAYIERRMMEGLTKKEDFRCGISPTCLVDTGTTRRSWRRQPQSEG